MEMRHKAYCSFCGKRNDYILESSEREVKVEDIIFSYIEIRALCKKCKNIVYVPEINDENYYERHKAYYNKLIDNFKENDHEHEGSTI